MTQADVHQLITMTLRTILMASAPVLVVALVVGLAVSFFQALTQIQEMTLTFVPKILAILVVLGIALPFMFMTLQAVSDQVFDLITSGAL